MSQILSGRYYVQNTGSAFLVRELQRPDDTPSEQDLIIRRFPQAADAHTYAQSMNRVQEGLDRKYGTWTHHAMTPQDEGEA